MKIQLYMPWKKAHYECEHMNESIKGIYDILDMVKYQTNQPETEQKIYNPVTGKYYIIRQRSSVNKNAGEIKGLWSYKDKE